MKSQGRVPTQSKEVVQLEARDQSDLKAGNNLKPFTRVSEAIQYIQEYQGKVSDFTLPICDSFYDTEGLNTTVLLEEIKRKGWTPITRYEQHKGYRIYRFK